MDIYAINAAAKKISHFLICTLKADKYVEFQPHKLSSSGFCMGSSTSEHRGQRKGRLICSKMFILDESMTYKQIDGWALGEIETDQ